MPSSRQRKSNRKAATARRVQSGPGRTRMISHPNGSTHDPAYGEPTNPLPYIYTRDELRQRRLAARNTRPTI